MDKLVPTTDRKVTISILHWEEVMQYTKDIGNYFKRNIGHLHYCFGMCNLATEVGWVGIFSGDIFNTYLLWYY